MYKLKTHPELIPWITSSYVKSSNKKDDYAKTLCLIYYRNKLIDRNLNISINNMLKELKLYKKDKFA